MGVPYRVAVTCFLWITVSTTFARVPCDGQVVGSGFATTYDYVPGNGNCSFTDDDELYLGAINAAQYDGSTFCGRFVRVTGPAGTVDVRIVDQCPECPAGDLDLNAAAFQAITGDTTGRYAITWETVDAPGVGDAGIRIASSSNPFFVQAQVVVHRYGVSQLELTVGEQAYVLPRESFNVFTASSTTGVPVPLSSPATFRVVDVHGQAIVVDGVSLTPGETSFGSSQFPLCEDATDVTSRPRSAPMLFPPVPNPFNPATTIAFELDRAGTAVVDVFDGRGRHVVRLVEGAMETGRHEVRWDGTDASGASVASGVYTIRLRTDARAVTRRAVLLQ